MEECGRTYTGGILKPDEPLPDLSDPDSAYLSCARWADECWPQRRDEGGGCYPLPDGRRVLCTANTWPMPVQTVASARTGSGECAWRLVAVLRQWCEGKPEAALARDIDAVVDWERLVSEYLGEVPHPGGSVFWLHLLSDYGVPMTPGNVGFALRRIYEHLPGGCGTPVPASDVNPRALPTRAVLVTSFAVIPHLQAGPWCEPEVIHQITVSSRWPATNEMRQGAWRMADRHAAHVKEQVHPELAASKPRAAERPSRQTFRSPEEFLAAVSAAATRAYRQFGACSEENVAWELGHQPRQLLKWLQAERLGGFESFDALMRAVGM